MASDQTGQGWAPDSGGLKKGLFMVIVKIRIWSNSGIVIDFIPGFVKPWDAVIAH